MNRGPMYHPRSAPCVIGGQARRHVAIERLRIATGLRRSHNSPDAEIGRVARIVGYPRRGELDR